MKSLEIIAVCIRAPSTDLSKRSRCQFNLLHSAYITNKEKFAEKEISFAVLKILSDDYITASKVYVHLAGNLEKSSRDVFPN